ncbi:hypothetical protein POJ06DRAFT_128934 [Lipomyces tetrasporus]|uniref:Autophagy-related protein 11 n=1 Tax=Lipomyces tetrasporus TaxID=54092 RepID=A0AAD7VRX3_9ASCO|nr:uncharacterized protein POJ06DRAFT_128934 [Lipomyces tetrasporus]KAJ8099144.1 hypothetical protein POJ06DRAFT_128934 [Lipomyces tetrasporus]
MSLRVYNAHTGKAIDINSEQFLSLPELKDALAMQHGVSSGQQIIMTSRATQLRMANLAHETELYLFDRFLLAHPSPTPPPSMSPLIPLNTQPFPNITNPKPTQAELVELFESRAAWSNGLFARAESLNSSLVATLTEIKTVRRSVDVAMAHLSQHLANIDKSFKDVLGLAVSISQEHAATDWNASLARLDHLTVIDCFGGGKLSAWVDHEKVKAIQSDLVFNNQNIRDRVRDIKFVSDKVSADNEALQKDIEAWNDIESKLVDGWDNTSSILEDLQAIVQKINKDAEYIADLPTTPASIRSIARMATLHQREYLPTISGAVSELWEYNRNAQSRKSAVQISSLRHLHTLSIVQSRASPIRPDLASVERELDGSQMSLGILKQMDSLPLIYGSLLIESIRRVEWNQRIKTLTGEVAEEFATWKEDEQKRRAKWLKRFGGNLDTFQQNFTHSVNANGVGGASATTATMSMNSIYSLRNAGASLFAVELNLISSKEETVLDVTRDDVVAFIESLKRVESAESMVSEIQSMFTELDQSTRDRLAVSEPRRERLFKTDSFTENMRNSMTLNRDNALQSSMESDDTARLLRENKRLQEKVKGYESRVRRLEDLLHRQYRTPPAGSSGIFPSVVPIHPLAVTRHQSVPLVDKQQPQHLLQQSHNSPPLSHSPRDISARSERTEGSTNGTASAMDLKAELQRLRATLDMERESSTRVRRQLEETEHNVQDIEVIKQDLLANLSQQEAEFQRERKSLNEEISFLKARIYALEDEEQTLEDSRVDKEGLIANLEHALDEQQQRERDLEDIKSGLDAEIRALRETLRMERDETARLNLLLNDESKTEDMLKARIDELVHKLQQADISSDNKVEYVREEKLRVEQELALVKSRLAVTEDEKSRAILESAVTRERSELLSESVRSMWHIISGSVEDEPSPEELESALKTKIEEQATVLTRLRDLESEVAQAMAAKRDLTKMYESRTLKARDLTQRLYTYYRRSRQLMDNLGIVYAGTKMVFNYPVVDDHLYKILPEKEREKRLADRSASTPDGDSTLSSIPDIDVLYWMDSVESDIGDSSAEADRYMHYLHAIEFDYDEFASLVRDRVKDAEYIASKWNKMARLYREKARRAKKDASEKIAYKSFKAGDLALFLPTSNNVNDANHVWAAFNDGAPYCFLRDDESHALDGRQWMVGRISRMEEDVDVKRSTDNVAMNTTPSETTINMAVADGRRFVVDAIEVGKDGAVAQVGTAASGTANTHHPPQRRPSALAAAAAKRTTRPELQDGSRSITASGNASSPVLYGSSQIAPPSPSAQPNENELDSFDSKEAGMSGSDERTSLDEPAREYITSSQSLSKSKVIDSSTARLDESLAAGLQMSQFPDHNDNDVADDEHAVEDYDDGVYERPRAYVEPEPLQLPGGF